MYTNVHICIYCLLGISQVSVLMIQCDLVNLINHCTVTWSWNSLQEAVTNFLVISNVGTFNVSSQNRSHTFTVLSLPGGALSSEVTVMVIVVNELGQGSPNEVARANITGKLQICIAMYVQNLICKML